MNDEKVREILDFWFKETSPEQKFKKDAEFDSLIKERFEATYEDVVAGKTEDWRETPEGRLAEIIVLDQFARNMFREDPKAFAADHLALELAEEARAIGADKAVAKEMRQFFYMPYMHSESKDIHKEAVKIFEEFGNSDTLKYEHMHKDIIDRFGRYPHRNEVLGRESTKDEIEFLKNNPGF